ncbi:MAG TPA: phosphotransferase family protein [Tepidiformaceae bacterium]|nr:phosphotransferase family protein [Tepidiformaceae bacterium]
MEDKLTRYLAPRIPGAQGLTISNLSRIPGGASRETWMFDANWHEDGQQVTAPLVLRKDPPASLLDTDREAEYAFYDSFWGTSVPVPRMRWLENDGSVLGGPFFLMDRILDCEGGTRTLQAPPYSDLQAPIAQHMYEILGAIAAFDWRGSPAEKFAEAPTPETAWSVELARWERIITEEELSPQPVMRAAIRWLRANPPPPAQRISVVHGDYRVGNFLYRLDGRICGIVDWEMAHLGDPLEDLAWSFNEAWQWAKDGRPGGIVDRATATRTWEKASGLTADPAAVHWWDVFTNVKCQGIWLKAARAFQEGKTNEIFLAVVAYTLINSQDQFLLRTLGRLT